jgi:hypothetical protein
VFLCLLGLTAACSDSGTSPTTITTETFTGTRWRNVYPQLQILRTGPQPIVDWLRALPLGLGRLYGQGAHDGEQAVSDRRHDYFPAA